MEADRLAPWVKLMHKLCPRRHQSSWEQGTTPVPQGEDVLTRWLVLAQMVYRPQHLRRARVTLNPATPGPKKI